MNIDPITIGSYTPSVTQIPSVEPTDSEFTALRVGILITTIIGLSSFIFSGCSYANGSRNCHNGMNPTFCGSRLVTSIGGALCCVSSTIALILYSVLQSRLPLTDDECSSLSNKALLWGSLAFMALEAMIGMAAMRASIDNGGSIKKYKAGMILAGAASFGLMTAYVIGCTDPNASPSPFNPR